jgi:hypothetical protein
MGADAHPAAHFLGQSQSPALIDVDNFYHTFSISYFHHFRKVRPEQATGIIETLAMKHELNGGFLICREAGGL